MNGLCSCIGDGDRAQPLGSSRGVADAAGATRIRCFMPGAGALMAPTRPSTLWTKSPRTIQSGLLALRPSRAEPVVSFGVKSSRETGVVPERKVTLTFAERVLHAKVIECKWDCTNWGIAYPAGSGQWIVEPVGTREDARRQLWHRRKQVLRSQTSRPQSAA